MLRFILIILLSFTPCIVIASQATNCADLKKLNTLEISAGKATYEAMLDCLEMGEDPPLHLRKRSGTKAIVTPTGNSYSGTPCLPGTERQCPNNARKYTDGSNSPSGYTPANNQNLQLPPLPWGDLNDSHIPCGAVVPFAKNALRSLLGNAQINSNTGNSTIDDLTDNVTDGINDGITGLLGNLFQYKDCQDGKFWGILNYVFNLVMGQGSYIYNVNNNTFISQDASTLITMPQGTTFSVTPSAGGGNSGGGNSGGGIFGGGGSNNTQFNLPNGGSFVDINGYQVNLNGGVQIEFTSTGLITTSDGNQYMVDPDVETVLNTNGVISIPAGVAIPVDPNVMIYPVSSSIDVPGWLNDDYVNLGLELSGG